jgi:thiamine biosynthesis lipoprotein
MAARRGYDISEGYFDVTSGPLMKLWGFHRKRESLPTDEELNLTLKRVGLENVLFDEENRSVRFAREGMVIDFGGIAKGYALDRCKSIVEKYSIKSGIIDLGGNVYCLKVPPENRSFYNVGIRKPRGYGLDDVVKIKDQFVATSGDYERFVIIDGKRITHIVNPKTGKPVENVASVSVVTAEGVDSDIFSTAIFVGGEEISKKLVKNSPSTQYMIVKAEGKERFSFVTYGNVWSKNRKEDEE